MQLRWEIEDEDIARVQALLSEMADDPFVVGRTKRNLAKRKEPVSQADVWWAMVMSRVTTRQRSGPDAPVGRFLSTRPFPLALDDCREAPDPQGFIEATISSFGGLRFAPSIASHLTVNLRKLEEGSWEPWMGHLNELRHPHGANEERAVARFFADSFKGLGSKQSRNLLQSLGLTLYEIPIDSRITKWLNRFGFPVRLTSGALSDRSYYEFVSDGIQALCRACDVYPCVLDAAIFASFDKGKWKEENLVY